jgi:hypothetical protein
VQVLRYRFALLWFGFTEEETKTSLPAEVEYRRHVEPERLCRLEVDDKLEGTGGRVSYRFFGRYSPKSIS